MDYDGAVLDVDGTVVRGDDPIPGAAEGYDRIRAAGIDPLFVSNNPTKAPPAYADRLAAAGFTVDPNRIVTAGTVTVDYLRERHPDADHFVIGESGLFEQLAGADLGTTDDVETADVLVASIDREFDYGDLRDALWALERDIPFIGTDPDVVIPAAERNVPGSGAVINAIAGVAERDPDITLGKPSQPAVDLVRERLGVDPERCLVVGDRLDTDIAFGERAGMTTVLVRTGITDDARLAATSYEPDYVLDSLAEIDRVLADGAKTR
ncbi:HAD-IIA family hydrolase [Halopenitus sp. POP-27]|uniref:HAD-IIA family hydrolase n=1 Tax=Halopenitus sp. POP-27 TaxID=2994425 RepID=UPI0024686816|nr:HAD-IIA family hydrolase [Halopenitus sp. POP-27]